MTLRSQESQTETPSYVAPPPLPLTSEAATERVTPREFAEAVAALEARRAHEATLQAETIPIAEAAAQLGLDLPPDEILAEVRRQRTTAAHTAAGTTQGQTVPQTLVAPPRVIRQRKVAVTAFTIFGLGLVAAGIFGMRQAAPPEAATAATVVSAAPETTTTTIAAATQRPTLDPARIRVIDRTTDGPVVRTLAEAPENHPVSVAFGDLNTALQVPVSEGEQLSSAAQWNVVRRGGTLYLQGWIGAPVSPGARKLGGVIVYNQRTTPVGAAVGPNPRLVTLRLDQIQGTTNSAYTVDSSGAYSYSDGNWQKLILNPVPGDFTISTR